MLRLAVVVLAALAAVAIAVWFLFLGPQPLLPEATAALASTDAVTFTDNGGYLTYSPSDRAPTAGLIVYPGGRVPPAAYARTARDIAAAGYRVVVVPMPLNLAVLGADRAEVVMSAYPEVQRWAIGGHSLGGAMACQYVSRNPGVIQGLALWASYCVDDVSGQSLDAVSLYGSLDAGAERMASDASRALLPPSARFVEIPGGNHEQMGDYTGQPNDPPATISRDAQRERVVAETVALLARVEAGP